MSKIKHLLEQQAENASSTDRWNLRFLRLAQEVSTWSKDPSTQVGSVIVRPNKSVASVGFNGFPQGADDSLHLYADRDYKLSRIIHAELNAITFSRELLEGYTMYVYPFICCDKCYALIKQEGITRIVAPIPTAARVERWGAAFDKVRKYASEDGVELLEIEYEA